MVPSASASAGAPHFVDHPLSASSPFPAALGGREGSTTRIQGTDLLASLPPLFRQVFDYSRSGELEGLDNNLLRDCMAEFIGGLALASDQALAMAQTSSNLEEELAKVKEDLANREQVFANLETALYLEVANLRQIEKDVKKALRDKSMEVVELEAKILPLRTCNVELGHQLTELKGKMVDLEDMSTRREVLLGKVEEELAVLKGELAEKYESFKRAEEELLNDAAAAYSEGFQDVVAQFTCAYPDTNPSLFHESKHVVDGQIVPRE